MAEPPNPSRQRVFGRKYEEHTLAGIVCLLNAANFTVPSTLNYRDGRPQLPAPAQHESLKAAFWVQLGNLEAETNFRRKIQFLDPLSWFELLGFVAQFYDAGELVGCFA